MVGVGTSHIQIKLQRQIIGTMSRTTIWITASIMAPLWFLERLSVTHDVGELYNWPFVTLRFPREPVVMTHKSPDSFILAEVSLELSVCTMVPPGTVIFLFPGTLTELLSVPLVEKIDLLKFYIVSVSGII